MHDEHLATGLADLAHKVAHKVVTLDAVNANAVLHRHWHIHHIQHGFHAIGHGARLVHQASTKSAALHPVAGAAAVEVDFVIAPLLAQLGGMGQIGRIAAAQLQGHRVFFGVEAQVAQHTAVAQSAGGHHLGVQPRMLGQQAVKVPAMTVGPVHHGRNAESPRAM